MEYSRTCKRYEATWKEIMKHYYPDRWWEQLKEHLKEYTRKEKWISAELLFNIEKNEKN